MRHILAFVAVLLSAAAPAFAATNYSIQKTTVEGFTTYHLLDAGRKMDVGIVPQIGNLPYEFKVNGKDVLIPTASLTRTRDRRAVASGMAFLAPWANRIDHDYYFFEGKKFLLNGDLGNLMRVPPINLVIHGLLAFDPNWKVVDSGASDADGAHITSRLEFFRYPELMAQFPFAQTYEITYRLKNGKLENITRVINNGAEGMPVFYGYHPYFVVDGPREDWRVSINATRHWKVNDHHELIPTGETEPAGDYLPGLTDFKLEKKFIDDGFSGLTRGADGLATYSVRGRTEEITLEFGKEYDYGHVYAPLGRPTICFEPQTGPANAFNLNHDGKFPELVVLKAGKTFEAHFWIVPTGY